MSLINLLQEEYNLQVLNPAETLAQCESIQTTFTLSDESFCNKLEAFLVTSRLETIEITETVLNSFRASLIKDTKKILTPSGGNTLLNRKTLKSNVVYKKTALGEKVEFSLNEALGHEIKKGVVKPVLVNGITEPFRYMYVKATEKATILNDQIEFLANLMKDHFQLPEFSHPGLPNQEVIFTAGRICCDSDAKLNDKSIILETSSSIGHGCRVPLAIAEESFILFPGMIVAVKGLNQNGSVLVAESVMTGVPPTPATPIDSATELSMVIACGPFTLDDDLDYSYLNALVSSVKDNQTLVLMGPFVDECHPLVKQGQFEQDIMKKIYEITNNKVIMIPSLRDFEHMNVLPQIPFGANSMSNPCLFSVSDVMFYVMNVDILMHLNKECVRKNITQPIDHLCSLLLRQKSMYPLFPPMQGTSIDLPKAKDLLQLNSTPHVIITPSQLVPFVKVVDGVIFINPGSMCKSKGLGSMAKLTVHAGENDLKDRIRVDIIRL